MLESATNHIDLWLVDERDVDDISLLDQYKALLHEEETKRHQRFVFDRHQHQFLVARALVRTVLSSYPGMEEPANLELSSNRDGKPELLCDSPLQFNLSHTRGLIALAVTPQTPVGIDVENLSRQADIARLAERYFSRHESAAMLALPVADWNERFFDLWTLKEAFLKACGTGLRTPLHEFSFTFDSDRIAVSFSSTLREDPVAWKFWQLQVDNDFRLSLAVNDPDDGNFRLRVRKGVPMKNFEDIAPILIRQSQVTRVPGTAPSCGSSK